MRATEEQKPLVIAVRPSARTAHAELSEVVSSERRTAAMGHMTVVPMHLASKSTAFHDCAFHLMHACDNRPS